MNIDIATSRKISLLSFVAAVLVVCLHVPRTSEMGLQLLVERFVGLYLGAIAVPFFFVVSGFFLGRHTNDPGWYRTALKKRVKSLLIPYLAWCVILGLIINCNSLIANVVNHQPLSRYINLNPIHIFGLNVLENPPQPLWFLRALMLYVLVSPLIMFIVRRKAFFAVAVVVLFALGCQPSLLTSVCEGDLFVFTLAPLNVLSFCLGLYVAQVETGEQNAVRDRGGGSLRLGFALPVGIMLLAVHFWVSLRDIGIGPELLPAMRQVAILLTMLGAWNVCPPVDLPEVLKGQSFPIYLLHGALMFFVLVVKNVFPRFAVSIAGYIVNVCLLVVGSVCVNALLRRYFPKAARVIFGGRQ